MADATGAATFRAPAEVYDRMVGRYAGELAQALIAAAGVAAGMRVLDVGCGPGALTRELAAVTGAGRVAAVDPSPPFADACRARVPGAEVREAAAEALPFADATFDAVLSQLVVNFLADAPAGVAEMRRVARPGAVVAACVWDYAEGMTLLRRFWDAARAVDPEGAAARDEGTVMRHCGPGELAALWAAAGLRDVREHTLEAGAGYEGFDALWEPFPLGVAPSGAYVAALAPEPREALRAALHERLGCPRGAFTLRARAWCVTGLA